MAHLSLAAIVVDDYDEAIRFFVDALDFELVEDSAAISSTDGSPKRWVVVRPRGGETAILLAKAGDDVQHRVVGNQTGGRVGFFLTVDDFEASHRRMIDAGVELLEPPRHESYGTVAVFKDLVGNRWDLLGPAPEPDR